MKTHCLAAALLCLPILAGAAPADDIREILLSLPGAELLKGVRATPVQNLFEVTLADRVAYAFFAPGEKGRERVRYWMLGGILYDGQKNEDLTAPALTRARKIEVGKLDTSLALLRGKEGAGRTIYLFTDPLCPYCAKLEKTLAGIPDLKIWTFLTALPSHEKSPGTIEAVWGAKDRTGALQKAFEGSLPIKDTRKAPVEEVRKLAASLHITSVPTIIFADGERITGAADRETIEARLGPARQGKGGGL